MLQLEISAICIYHLLHILDADPVVWRVLCGEVRVAHRKDGAVIGVYNFDQKLAAYHPCLRRNKTGFRWGHILAGIHCVFQRVAQHNTQITVADQKLFGDLADTMKGDILFFQAQRIIPQDGVRHDMFTEDRQRLHIGFFGVFT